MSLRVSDITQIWLLYLAITLMILYFSHIKSHSVKYEILKKTCSDNYCIDSLKGFKVLEPYFEPPSEPTYTCIDSPCISSAYQPNGNQYCTINYADLALAKGACEFYGCDTIIQYSHNQQCKINIQNLNLYT